VLIILFIILNTCNKHYKMNIIKRFGKRQEYTKTVCGNVLFVGLMIEIQRLWLLTKPLHEQTPKTWEKIMSIICK
jgi:hypothetical protein